MKIQGIVLEHKGTTYNIVPDDETSTLTWIMDGIDYQGFWNIVNLRTNEKVGSLRTTLFYEGGVAFYAYHGEKDISVNGRDFDVIEEYLEALV